MWLCLVPEMGGFAAAPGLGWPTGSQTYGLGRLAMHLAGLGYAQLSRRVLVRATLRLLNLGRSRQGKKTSIRGHLADLETYLSDGIYSDREDIATIEQVLVTTGETIAENFDDKTKDWPYEIRRQDGKDSRDFSQSTTAMMIRAIDLLRETVPGSTR